MPVHPRLAHMMLRARTDLARRRAAQLAAIVNERDPIRFSAQSSDPDIRLRLELLEGSRRGIGVSLPAGATPMRDVLDRIAREASRLADSIGSEKWPGADVDDDDAGSLLALAYPDRVAMQRPGQRGRYVTRDGIDVILDAGTLIANESFIVAAQLDGKRPLSRAWLAAPIERTVVERLFSADIQSSRTVAWNEATESVTATEQRRLGSIVLAERSIRADPGDVAEALLTSLLDRGFLAREEITAELSRLAFANAIDPRPGFQADAETLARSAREWLLPSLSGIRSLAAAEKVDLREALLSRLEYRDRKRLDEIAPTHIVVPTGTRVTVDYSDVTAPFAAVRIQELFGLLDTPRVGLGRIALTLHLLSPAHRPVQVTRDLAGFWKNSYFDVRKDLRGRYPKHPWPDDPATATPTRRTKPR
jgi:ATP-dependent helicase HrpB